MADLNSFLLSTRIQTRTYSLHTLW